MDEEAKTNEESWEVEPPKKTSSRKRKALRIALIVAALGAAAIAAGGVYVRPANCRTRLWEQMREHPGGVIMEAPRPRSLNIDIDGGRYE